MESEKTNKVLDFLAKTYPDARCALDFSTPFQCLAAVMLSAQTTDVSVNKITPKLFGRYPDATSMAKADLEEVESIIMSIGLYHNKARNLISMSQRVVELYDGEIPSDKEKLQKLPGVGIKTANVVGAECFKIPAIAVDTHVHRIAIRLGYAPSKSTPVEAEKKLERAIRKDEWIPTHHRMIWFGRTICKAQSPDCSRCELGGYCRYFRKNSSKTDR